MLYKFTTFLQTRLFQSKERKQTLDVYVAIAGKLSTSSLNAANSTHSQGSPSCAFPSRSLLSVLTPANTAPLSPPVTQVFVFSPCGPLS